MNENFITMTLTMFNVMVILSNIVIRLTLKEYEGNPFYNVGIDQYAVQSEFHKQVNLL